MVEAGKRLKKLKKVRFFAQKHGYLKKLT